MKQILYYANGGSGNHGCEAIIRSLERILRPDVKSRDLTIALEQDIHYGLSKFIELVDVNACSGKTLEFVKAYIKLKLLKSTFALDVVPYKTLLKQIKNRRDILALSVGGDNYCYGGTGFYYELDRVFHNRGLKTAMVGCSIEPNVIKDKKVRTDLASHEVIIARESITYRALLDEGLKNVVLLPDPAFLLNTKKKPLPFGFVEGNTIGLNLSPMVDKYSNGSGIVTRNADRFIQFIIENTDLQIELIPHVVWPQSNDFDTLKPLYEKYKDTGRVILIEDCNAEELKGYIARCRFLIAARTHASIAAYSNCVPTLVIGYSVKAKGIAKDIFGTYDNYVLPSQTLKTDTDLIDAFEWLKDNEDSIRAHLNAFMPDYCKKAYRIKDELERIK